jgi:hypothetical protein
MDSGRGFLIGGQRSGRRYATELAIIANACSVEEAKLCLEDLESRGIAMQDDRGRRIDPATKTPARLRCVRFDEEKTK